MQPLPNATEPLFDTLATVPPVVGATPIMTDGPFNPFGFIVALIGLAVPMIFYIVWIAVGVAVLVYLRRQLKGS